MKSTLILISLTLGNLVLTTPLEEVYDVKLYDERAVEKCYGPDIGCFTTEGWRFLERPVNFLPAARDKINTRFYLYTQNNPTTKQQIVAKDEASIRNSSFVASKPTKFIIHGLFDHGEKDWVKAMVKNYLTHGDFNVISVDWGKGSGLPYTQATANTRLVGRELALLVEFLRTKFDLDPDNVHIAGHSLGAHVAGYAGEKMRQNGFPIGRISGLDPAEPYFQNTAPFVHLDPTDAKFVDVIHSDTRHLLQLGYGMSQLVGHVDVYPNGGERQPGCDQSLLSYVVVEGIFKGVRQFVACNHLRAIDYFTESIISECPFLAIKCDSYEKFKNGECWYCGINNENCAEMGYQANKYNLARNAATSKMYIDTGERLPFCLFHYQVHVQLASNSKAKDQNGKMYLSVQGTKGTIHKVTLNSKTINFKHGQSYTFLFTTRTDVGTISSIDFNWQYFGNILNPVSWGIFRNAQLYVSEVLVRSLSFQTTSVFCDGQGASEPDKPRVLYPTKSCS